MLKNCKTLEQVIQSLFDHYHSVEEKSPNVRAIPVPSNNSVIIMNAKTGKQAIARCRKGDTYDYATGVAIAWAKYTHRNPKVQEVTSLKSLRVGDTFTIRVREGTSMNSFVITDFVENHVYCRRAYTDENGVNSEYKRFTTALIVATERTLY